MLFLQVYVILFVLSWQKKYTLKKIKRDYIFIIFLVYEKELYSEMEVEPKIINAPIFTLHIVYVDIVWS